MIGVKRMLLIKTLGREKAMPYVINMRCTGEDTACVEACPLDCIYPNKGVSAREPLFFIDADQCTDCGACALVCPESAITTVAEFGRYVDPAARPNNPPVAAHLRTASNEEVPTETPASQVILREWVETFAASHV